MDPRAIGKMSLMDYHLSRAFAVAAQNSEVSVVIGIVGIVLLMRMGSERVE
jgi:hypothetical protein